MLRGEDFCGSHESDVEAGLEDHEGGGGGDDSFAGADIALEKASHGAGGAKVSADFAEDAGLGFGQAESELAQEGAHQAVIAGAGAADGVGEELLASALEFELESD